MMSRTVQVNFKLMRIERYSELQLRRGRMVARQNRWSLITISDRLVQSLRVSALPQSLPTGRYP